MVATAPRARQQRRVRTEDISDELLEVAVEARRLIRSGDPQAAMEAARFLLKAERCRLAGRAPSAKTVSAWRVRAAALQSKGRDPHPPLPGGPGVTIGVVCPHCDTRYQLNPDLLGKSMRCPNRECGEVFDVTDADAAPAPAYSFDPVPPAPAPASVPASTAGSVTDFVPVLDVFAPPPPPKPVPQPQPQRVFEAELITAEPPPQPTLAKVLAAPPKPVRTSVLPPLPVATLLPGPKEVHWSEAETVRDGAVPKPARKDEEDDHLPIRTRAKKKGGMSKVVFSGLVVVLLGTVGGSVYLLFLREAESERKSVAEAESLFNDGRYGDALAKYDKLIEDYPDSESVDKYRFFAKFSGVQTSIGAVATRDNPAAAQKVFAQFAAEFGDKPEAKPMTGSGALVDQAGQKLTTILHDHAADRVKDFRKDRSKPGSLEVAEKSIADGRALLATLDKYRDPSTPGPDSLRAKFDAVTAEIAAERARMATIDPWRQLAADPTEQRIEEFETAMGAAGLGKDAEVVQMAADARKAIRDLLRFTPDRVAARRLPIDRKSVAFFAPAVLNSPEQKKPLEVNAETVYAVSRGILYALDVHTGDLQWATRVAALADPRPPEPLVVTLGDGAGEWAIVPTNVDGKPAVVARRGRTGEPEWLQTLPAPALGRPVLIGGQLFLALQDAVGSIVQLDLRTGEKQGGFEIRQRFGTPLGVLPGVRPGHGFLVAPGDSRKVFVFEIGREAPDGGRLPPACVRILLTDHPRDSLLGDPLMIATADAMSPRRLVLAQRAGTKGTKLRAFGLPNAEQLSAGKADAETPAEQTAEVTVPGHIGFPPVSDGERVAVATDAGTFAVYGVAQPGNTDAPLFSVPGTKVTGDPEALDAAQVVSADDDSYWVLANGKLQRMRTAVDPVAGPKVTPSGEAKLGVNPVSLGAAAGRPQVRMSLNMGVVTVRPEQADAVHLVAFDLETGEVKWWRQLGAVAAHPPIPMTAGGHLLVDQAGGVYRIDRTVPPDGDPVVTTTVLAKPRGSATGLPADVAVSPDGKTVWVTAPDATKDGVKLLVRKFTDGKADGETTVPISGKPAGPTLLLGDKLLLPLNNGYVYRVGIADTEAQQGPLWKRTGTGDDVRCFLTATGPDEFLLTDGDIRALRFKWAGDQLSKPSGPWAGRNPLSRPVTVVTVDEKPHYLLADAKGIVLLFDPAKTTEPVRRWNGSAEGPIPVGPATGPVLIHEARVIATVDRKAVVALDPAKDGPLWVMPEPPAEVGEVVGFTAAGKRVLVTYLSGVVREFDPATGVVTGETRRDPAAGTVRVPAIRLTDTEVLTPSASGAVGTAPLIPTGK